MDNNFLVPIGKRISEIRRAHGITQEALADILSVSPKHISHTECGTSTLSLKNLIHFCHYFNCSLDYIVMGKSDNTILAKLPDKITALLLTGSQEEIQQLNRYLQMYIELTQKQE